MANGRTVSKADLVNLVAEQTGFRKKEIKDVLDLTLQRIVDFLAEGDKVQLTGFGTFEVRERRARTGVRPGTTERIEIPASTYPAFKAGKNLRDRVTGQGS
jgi:DNA-binding protein HU-beta